jgi:carbonic anhydrase
MPFATIFGCDDSRVPPEVIFDRGLGDLFVVRTAGHVVDDTVLGSLEFGANELHIPLLVVMGHERCSAVKTAMGPVTSGRQAPGELDWVVKGVRPAIVKTLDTKNNALDAAVRANVELTVERLRKAPLLAGLVAQGKLTIVGARYDLDTGGVEVIVP